jgi:N-acetyl-anhydromuramyl-L-alanine amidase AmpD
VVLLGVGIARWYNLSDVASARAADPGTVFPTKKYLKERDCIESLLTL